MEKNLIDDLCLKGFLLEKTINGEETYLLSTPCKFRFIQKIVENFKHNYLPDEEIGGLLWAKPTIKNGERIFIVEKVSYIRNAISDKARTDNLNKSNAYLDDEKEKEEALNSIFTAGYIPLKFHSHLTKGANPVESIFIQLGQEETSPQDRIESKLPFLINKKKLLTPRVLIVGNEFKSGDLVIGVYDGEIAPLSFEETKENIVDENMKSFSNTLSSIELSRNQKIGLVFTLGLLLFCAFKYPKTTMPLLIGSFATVPVLASSTEHLTKSNYYAKLSHGAAEIFIPKWDE